MTCHSYADVTKALRVAYDRAASARDDAIAEEWKLDEYRRLHSLLASEGRSRLLEVGSGPGVAARFFADAGLDVTCTDLSPENVRLCREKGLTALVMDVLSLDFGGRAFEAVFATNCLLHVPKNDLMAALTTIRSVLEPGGLFYLGQYGGLDREGPIGHDTYDPPRFYSLLSDETLVSVVSQLFDVADFRRVPIPGWRDQHFQALTLRR